MSALVDFLIARLDEDEAIAINAQHSDAKRPGDWVAEHFTTEDDELRPACHIAEDRAGHYWSVAHDVFAPNAEHMARHDPRRVLAYVAAMREVVDIFKPGPEHNDPRLLRILAWPYADHSDYQQDWAQ